MIHKYITATYMCESFKHHIPTSPRYAKSTFELGW